MFDYASMYINLKISNNTKHVMYNTSIHPHTVFPETYKQYSMYIKQIGK